MALTLLGNKRIFGFDNEKFQEMGSFKSKISLIIRIFMKYFVSPDRAAEKVANMWEKYHTIGKLKVIENNKEERYTLLRLENFNLHPLHCLTLRGYFASVLKMIVGEDVTCEETKCIHRGNECHEFIMRW